MITSEYDTIIIGSGPAAFTAAIYTTRGAASTLILGGQQWGGQLMLTSAVDNFPGFPEGILGPELMSKMKSQAEKHGAIFLPQKAIAVNFSSTPFEVSTSENTYPAKSVIVATGAETLWLDAPGIANFIGKGVSSCAPCDAPFFKNKRVAVVGGGDSAMEEALVLAKYATQVTIIHRRDVFRASQIMVDKVTANPKINILWNTEVVEAKGDQILNSLVLKNNKDQKQTKEAFDGLFVAIGHKPTSELFKGVLDMDEQGFLQSKSKIPGIFIAGDVHDHIYKQAITAAGFGCMAAMDALKYLDEQ